jgi:hypothetical protein
MIFKFEVEAGDILEAVKKLGVATAPIFAAVAKEKSTTKAAAKTAPVIQVTTPEAPTAPEPETAEFNFSAEPDSNATAAAQTTMTGAPKPGDGTVVTKEMVRAKWSAISQSGYQAELQKVLAEYGAKKLLAIPEDKYPELVKKANDFVANLMAQKIALSDLLKAEFCK